METVLGERLGIDLQLDRLADFDKFNTAVFQHPRPARTSLR